MTYLVPLEGQERMAPTLKTSVAAIYNKDMKRILVHIYPDVMFSELTVAAHIAELHKVTEPPAYSPSAFRGDKDRRAVARGDVAVNPTSGIELPAVRGRRERIASPEEAAKLIESLPRSERALWATAMYAGLRLGELRALRWQDVDLAAGIIRVERSWDARQGPIEPKSRAGKRNVPIPAVLRDALVEHRMDQGEAGGLVFGRSVAKPFTPGTVANRARAAWDESELHPITLHEARHTFASLMIAAGVNAKALSTYMGHSSITITLDRYGHLLPGNENHASELLDSFLKRELASVP